MSRRRQGGRASLVDENYPDPMVDWLGVHPIINTSNWLINETNLGMGFATGASSLMLCLSSVGKDMKITTSMKYTTGTVDLRILARIRSNLSQDSVDSATYYWAGCTGTAFRLGKTVNGTFTTLKTVAYTLPTDTWATFTLKVFGNTQVATIDDGVQAVQTLSDVDTAIPSGGVAAFRSGPTNACNVWCRSRRIQGVAA